MGFVQEGEDQSCYLPGVSTFRKTPKGAIVRIAKDYFGPGDPYCSIWHLFDLLAEGPAGWEPKFEYR
jgi:hypothetical protein